MNKIKNLAIIISVCFAISFLDGFASWGIMDTGFGAIIGFIMIIGMIWIDLILFNPKGERKSAIERLKDEVV
jgi:hypothetical protein